jgi:hypothetical protein
MRKRSMISKINENLGFYYPRSTRAAFLALALLVCIVLPGAEAQSIESLTSPEPQGGIKFNETYFIANLFDSFAVKDMAFNSKGKIVITTPGSTSGADLWFLGPDGTATNEASNPYPQNGAYGIAADSKGNFWFVENEYYLGTVGVVNSKGQITKYTPPGDYSFQQGITLGSDGAMWVLAYSNTTFDPYVGRIAGDGTFTAYPLPAAGYASSIATGSDGNVWVKADYGGGGDNEILVSVTPSGQTTSYVTETNCSGTETQLHTVVLGPDGNIWFSSLCGLGIGNITPSGVVTFFPFTDPDNPEAGFSLASGSDGAVWFITPVIGYGQPDHLGRITTSGTVTYTDISNSLGNISVCANDELIPLNIAQGSKGTLQFYAVNGSNVNPCGAVISFTPAPPGVDQKSEPLGIQPQYTFACASGAAQCEFDIIGGYSDFVNYQAIYLLKYTEMPNYNGYGVGISDGENFGLCNASLNGQPVYAKFLRENFTDESTKGYGTVFSDGGVANPFSAKLSGLTQGQKLICTFPFNFESCPSGGGKCTINATQNVVYKTIVGP